jgi:hypothetical protein
MYKALQKEPKMPRNITGILIVIVLVLLIVYLVQRV